ncbi:hypothetical protein G3M48_004755 [Beauveria asiatica]|uniref:Uncharacterized protein n=1 Tax=Beauveria asiatica TaxID=1069075 RepID=A0AAW0S5U8_9HYPO
MSASAVALEEEARRLVEEQVVVGTHPPAYPCLPLARYQCAVVPADKTHTPFESAGQSSCASALAAKTGPQHTPKGPL